MAAKRNASGLSALPRPSLDNEELVSKNYLIDVDEDSESKEKLIGSAIV